MARLELPAWFLAIALVTAGAIGGGACAAIDCLITHTSRKEDTP